MTGLHMVDCLDATATAADALQDHLCSAYDNGRVLRLLLKLGVVNERPDGMGGALGSGGWSETGDRYVLKLFRDYLFHQVDGEGNPVVAFTQHIVSTVAESTRAVGAADVDDDGAIDVLAGFFFEIDWHPGNGEEICSQFDASDDGRIDGVEVIWLGEAFTDICEDPGDPEAEWWFAIDANRDCFVDGEDLAILASSSIFGRTVDECSYTCQ